MREKENKKYKKHGRGRVKEEANKRIKKMGKRDREGE
jgi:hypothetical protein